MSFSSSYFSYSSGWGFGGSSCSWTSCSTSYGGSKSSIWGSWCRPDPKDDDDDDGAGTLSLSDDILEIGEDGPAGSVDVTENDTIPEGATIALGDLSQVPGGTVTLSPDGVLSFDPGTDFDDLADGVEVSFDVTYTVTLPAPEPAVFSYEAEDLAERGFHTVSGDGASGGELIKLGSKSGWAKLNDFGGEDGVYDISLFIQDESDGQSKVWVYVDGKKVEALRLKGDGDGIGSDDGGFSEFVIADVAIDNGDDIKIAARRDGNEFVRFDKMVIADTSAPVIPLTETGTVTVTVTGANDAPAIETTSLSADEGQTDAGTIIATDPDGDTVTYAITGGADEALFDIDTDTGALTFVDAPDFETPGDENSDNTYEVTVSATDGTETDEALVTVAVQDVAENGAPEITNKTDDVIAISTTLEFYDVDFTDPDGDSIDFSLGGADAGVLEIDENGVITRAGGGPLTLADTGPDSALTFDVFATDPDGAADQFELTITLVTVG